MITIKRVYELPQKSDGIRILVDRLWPRGLTKEKAKIDVWMKDIAPSDKLRTWFGHDPARWRKFKQKYRDELKKNQDLIGQIRNLESSKKTVTILFGANDEIHNNAVVLKAYLAKKG